MRTSAVVADVVAVLGRLLARGRKGVARRLGETSRAAEHPPAVDAARAAGWRLTRARRVLLEDVGTVLSGRRRPRVAVVGDTPRRGEPGGMQGVLAGLPHARVHLLDAGLDASQLHARLAAVGRFDVIVVDSMRGAPALSRLHDVFFHLRRGGAVFLRCPPGARDPAEAEDVSGQRWSHLAGFVDYLAGAVAAPSYTGVSGREERAQVVRRRVLADRRVLAGAIGRLAAGPHHVMAENQLPALAKMREHEMDQVLELRPATFGRVLQTLPGGRFPSRCVSRESTDRPGELMYPTYNAPPVSLREYTHVTCRPQQVAVQRHLLLPDTYRKNQAPRLLHSGTEETAERFARPLDRRDPTSLPGTYFYLDTEFPGHFGHAMTEQLSRLWALPAARRAHPELKALVSRRPAHPQLTSFERHILGAGGLADDDIVVVDRPVKVDRLLAATPMFSTPDYVHPGIEDLWGEVGDVLVRSAPDRSYPARVFCSRRARRRPCHNASEVEALFEAQGFAVVFPEDLPFVEQARMFREAEVIAGFAGSALLSLVFSRSGKHVIVLSSESYTARNEYMICSVLGHRLDVAWSRPDVDHPEDGWDPAAFRSGFTFDFAREGLFLDQVLESLGSR